MVADKYEFIQELFSSNKLTPAQRERLLVLTSEEIKKDKRYNVILEGRVKNLEEKISNKLNIQTIATINIDNKVDDDILKSSARKIANKLDDQINKYRLLKLKSNNITEVNINRNPSLPEQYFDPSSLYKYLLAFNQDPILKSTCHLIDSNELEKINNYCNTETYDYDKHIIKIIEAFSKINLLFAPTYIKALIRGYLTGKNYKGDSLVGWSKDNIKYSWSDNDIAKWTRQNIGIPPNPDVGLSNKLENIGYEFRSPIKINEDYLQSFSDLVIHFKKMFHIREDNSLFSILIKRNKSRNWNNEIDFVIEKSNVPENIEFFTDIDKLMQSYDDILQLIILKAIEKKVRPIVQIKLYEKGNSIFFSIHDLNGIYGKSIKSATNRLIGDQYEKIVSKLNGICNLYLQANFGQNNFYKLTIWDSKWNIQKNRNEQKVEKYFTGGVEHILEFKRS